MCVCGWVVVVGGGGGYLINQIFLLFIETGLFGLVWLGLGSLFVFVWVGGFCGVFRECVGVWERFSLVNSYTGRKGSRTKRFDFHILFLPGIR